MVNKKQPVEYVDLVTPERYKFPASIVEAAQKPLTDTMTYGEAKTILDAQKRLQREYAKAALYHIKETTGRNLTKEIPNWKGHVVQVTGNLTGKVIITQYLYDERSPRQKWGTWEFNKSLLLKKYYTPKKESQKD